MRPVVFSDAEADSIRALSEAGLTAATWADDAAKAVKATAKAHYIAEQSYRCCYCTEQWLTENHRVWDLEHVVPKAGHPEFMFLPQNLAISCPDCNNAKWNKETLIDPTVAVYPSSSEAFLVVHPHFDDWDDHITMRGRLVFKPITDKGSWTVRNCNLGRFAMMHVDPADELNPLDDRFEFAVSELTSDRATAMAALTYLRAYLDEI